MVGQLLTGGRPEVPPAAALPGPDTPAFAEQLPAYTALMQQCWAQRQEDRPEFDFVIQELRWG